VTSFTEVGIIIVEEHATYSALKKEAACPSETLVTTHQNNTEDIV
jgi:hypothetical protein